MDGLPKEKGRFIDGLGIGVGGLIMERKIKEIKISNLTAGCQINVSPYF